VVAGTGSFKAGHCKSSDAGPGNFSHVSIASNTTTEVTAADLDTAGQHVGAELKATVAGSAIAVGATAVSGTGSIFNSEAGSEMLASGEGKLKYTGVAETLLGCQVKGPPGGPGVIDTKQLAAATARVGNKVKVSPQVGTPLAEFKLIGWPGVANTYKVVGCCGRSRWRDSKHRLQDGHRLMTLRLQSSGTSRRNRQHDDNQRPRERGHHLHTAECHNIVSWQRSAGPVLARGHRIPPLPIPCRSSHRRSVRE
jgi:hypothetical protein